MRRTVFRILVTAAMACTSYNVLAAGSEPSDASVTDDPDWKAGKAAIEAKSWKSAITSFNKASNKFRDNADIYNYLGYAYRQSGDLDGAFKNYRTALQIEPAHKGAHEYMGEAFLMKNDLTGAQKQLQELERICEKNCDEYRDLAQAIDDYKAKKPIASKW